MIRRRILLCRFYSQNQRAVKAQALKNRIDDAIIRSGGVPTSETTSKNSTNASRKQNIISSKEIECKAVDAPDQPAVPGLAHDLDKVLFSPGVHFLKDPRTKIFNFTPFLENIMSIKDFDFTRIAAYVPSGKDSTLAKLAQSLNKRFVGSTSSLTGVLMKFHQALSHMRPPSTVNVSKNFPGVTTNFTEAQVRPVSVFLKWNKDTSTFSIDSDKGADEDILLSILGHNLETMLTTHESKFVNYDKALSHKLEKEDVNTQNTYNYTECGEFLMRSQLDCYDARLPGTGMFDLKTRAVAAVRHDLDYVQVHDGSDYQIKTLNGEFESFEREWYELIRSSLFKYSLQARIGRMDGIFLAYHNVRSMFGFQYIPLSEMDMVFHSIKKKVTSTQNSEGEQQQVVRDVPDKSITPEIATNTANTEFSLSVRLLQDALSQIIEDLPRANMSCNVVFSTHRGGEMSIFVKPMNEKHIESIQTRKQTSKIPTRGDSSNYKLYHDPHTIWQHAEQHAELAVPDIYAYTLKLTSEIGGETLLRSQYPTVLPGDEWRLTWRLRRSLPGSTLWQHLYTNCFKNRPYVLRQMMSSPQTKRLDEATEIKMKEEILELLQPPTELQATLREYARKGAIDKDEHQGHDKIQWRPSSE